VCATINKKEKIGLPTGQRHRLGLRKGDVLAHDENAPFVKATRTFDRAAMLGVVGTGARKRKGRTAAQWLTELRGPAALSII
jgi:hypothetical protein